MKNVLIISSTPRKGGNSDILCDEFAAGAKEAGNKVEKVRIADKKIGYCTGFRRVRERHGQGHEVHVRRPQARTESEVKGGA